MKKRERERLRKERESESASTAEQHEGRHTQGPKERKEACRGVPSLCHHCDATRNRESDMEKREKRQGNEREERETEKGRGGVLVSMRAHVHEQ